jgi:hypothetical protein
MALDALGGKIDFLELIQFCVQAGPIAVEHYYRFRHAFNSVAQQDLHSDFARAAHLNRRRASPDGRRRQQPFRPRAARLECVSRI